MMGSSRFSARASRRGISLIEALVAMAVMAFGMLGVVGMQATLRGNADLSKQRTEAMRIAQERMEGLRNFSVLTNPGCPAPPAPKAFDCQVTFGATAVAGYTTNTAYTVSGTVTPPGAAAHKTLTINVSWSDRAGATQNVSLVSAMARIAPELGASLVVSPQGFGGVRDPGGRRRGIPPQAKNFGDGTSGFRPPQGVGGTVAWLFNNATGLITSLCTTTAVDNATLTLGTIACTPTPGAAYQLISGYIRFDLSTPPTTASVTTPTSAVPNTIEAEIVQTLPTAGTIACFHGYAADYADYFCAVPVTTPTPANWTGTLRIRPATLAISPNLADVTPTNRKVCRYRAAATYAPPDTGVPLANQNLVVIAAPFACPAPLTWAHQPAT